MPVIGTQQSPIRINTSETLLVCQPQRIFQVCYQQGVPCTGKFDMAGTGHGNLVLQPPYPKVKYQGDCFELRKVHIHLKSEHLIDSDDPKDYEVHLLHLPEGSTAGTDPKVVIGILYRHDPNVESGGGLEWLEKALRSQEEKGLRRSKNDGGDCSSKPFEFEPLWFFPSQGDANDVENWFHYQGSLTSEPFSEDVSWFVMKNESVINKDRIGRIEQCAEQHARTVYALNRRFILRSFEQGECFREE
ncbi:hypothetical protein DTL42_18385 [Bremerella cremea]|uniref:carbonic anhydrase n=1 Tax=Bremerella cremea TaxID=1031537 RepID=A0A368KMX3_9BACT|nr:carbonic anhydrase family protein [Bremerella cremea]RCS43955.1 hypothetical protein DTL42_18385 [Bremerella cremea]